MATGCHLRAKQKAGTDAPPLGKSSAPALKALALFDIHHRLCPAVPAVDDEIFRRSFRPHLEDLPSTAGRADQPSVLHNQFTIFAGGFQLFHSLSLGLFTCYTWFPGRIKTRGLSGFRLRGGLAPFPSFLTGR